MEPEFQPIQDTPVTITPTLLEQEALAAHEPPKYPLHLFGALIVAVGAVYGILMLSEPSQAIETHTAAVATSIVEKQLSAYDSLTLEAQSAFVVDLSENKIVHTKNADVQLPLASITKVALVLAVTPLLSLDDTTIISESAVTKGLGGLALGDVWLVQDLVDFTLVASSNAGAEALAEAAHEYVRARYPQAPETDATVWRMNQLAKELGLTKTYFLNASGLDVSATQPGAMSSARDATILLAYAYKTNPELFAQTKSQALEVGPVNGPKILAENTNDAIGSISGLKMGKTGFTDLAGGNLGVVFESNGHTFVATVMGSSIIGRFNDIVAITEAARQ